MCNHDAKTTSRRDFLTAATAGTAAIAAASLTSTAARAQAMGPEQAEEIIKDWPETATMAAKAMIEKYGAPAEATPSLLIWYDNGPWKRTVVYKEEIDHDFPMPHKDVLEQFVNYEVPPDKFDELAQYDGSVIVERTKGVISTRCDKETANFLALNLANDIVQGNKSVEEARQAYGESMMQMMQGNPPENTQAAVRDGQRRRRRCGRGDHRSGPDIRNGGIAAVTSDWNSAREKSFCVSRRRRSERASGISIPPASFREHSR